MIILCDGSSLYAEVDVTELKDGFWHGTWNGHNLTFHGGTWMEWLTPKTLRSCVGTINHRKKIQNYDNKTNPPYKYDNCAWKPSASSMYTDSKQYDKYDSAWIFLHSVSLLLLEQYENWSWFFPQLPAWDRALGEIPVWIERWMLSSTKIVLGKLCAWMLPV